MLVVAEPELDRAPDDYGERDGDQEVGDHAANDHQEQHRVGLCVVSARWPQIWHVTPAAALIPFTFPPAVGHGRHAQQSVAHGNDEIGKVVLAYPRTCADDVVRST